MGKCVVKTCCSRSDTHFKSSGITFHSIPKDPNRREKWIRAIRFLRKETDWLPSKTTMICSKHFRNQYMIVSNNNFGRTYLSKDAVPTILMPRCSATNCRNMGSHTFPKDPEMRLLWEKATKKDNFTASKHSRLCSGHFKPSDYIDMCTTTGVTPYHKYLKKSAVPSIFPCVQESKHRYASRQQVTRHLKKGVVPSVFPWTKNEKSPATESADTQTCTLPPPPEENDSKENIVSPPIVPKEEKIDTTEVKTAVRDRSVRLRDRKAYLANRKCSVPQCNSRPTNEISLHPCPNNAAVRNEWAEALRVSYHYVKNMVACSLHFMKIDFIQSKKSERVLKHNAVPSRNLPIRRKINAPVKHKPLKKEVLTKAFERQMTMTESIDKTKAKQEEEHEILECRACLKKLVDKNSYCNVFQAWALPWEGMEATIAEDLAKLANVEISKTDRHSKVICVPCYQKLLDAARFSSSVRFCDYKLRMRFTGEIDMEKVWPKPIQVDKNIDGSVYINPMEVEVKQEVLSDEECPANVTGYSYVENELASLDIKIEPEEFVEPPPMNITINGTISLNPLNSENKDVTNGTDSYQETQYLDLPIKQEPTSEGEQESEQAPDLPLECLLCTKSFNSVTGLKAHVIAQHSYKTVKRKLDGSESPEKKRSACPVSYTCAICKRSFQTSTDLMVHETCHNKHACYGCTEKFDTFELLTRHRKRCKASFANIVKPLKTLEDAKRRSPVARVELLEKIFEKEELETTTNEDIEMKDLNSNEKERNSRDTKKESVNEAIEKVNEETEQDNILKSVNKEEDSVIQQLESINEVESKDKCIKEEMECGKTEEHTIHELESEKKAISEKDEEQSGITKAENAIEELQTEIKEDKVVLSAKEEFPIQNVNKQEDEIKEDPDSNMKLHLEILSTKSETEPMLNDTDMSVEIKQDDCT